MIQGDTRNIHFPLSPREVLCKRSQEKLQKYVSIVSSRSYDTFVLYRINLSGLSRKKVWIFFLLKYFSFLCIMEEKYLYQLAEFVLPVDLLITFL